jgi:hypothetical protein
MAKLLSLILFASSLFAEDPIGKMTAVEGSVQAVDVQSQTRALAQGALIYVADTIAVGADSKAQVQFTDGSLFNLIADTEFRVDEYRYKKIFKKDGFTGNLLKGGFRNLSGNIAKKNQNEYEIKTPNSVIGLRGTIVLARMVDETLYVGVLSGSAAITNPTGTALIGEGRSQFAAVSSLSSPPQLLTERPITLDKNLFSEPPGGISIERAQQAQQEKKRTMNKLSSGADRKQPTATVAPEAFTERKELGPTQLGPDRGGAKISGGC